MINASSVKASSVTSTILNDDVPPNRYPIAVNDGATIAVYQSVNLNVLVNGIDPDDSLTLSIVTNPSNESAIINNNTLNNPKNDFIAYTSVAGYCRNDRFKYHEKDGKDGTAIATVNIAVAGENLISTTRNDSALVGTDRANTIDGTGNDHITGKQDDDSLTGCGGQDRFVYLGNGIETIIDLGGVGKEENPAAGI
jgi:hypothetical protein